MRLLKNVCITVLLIALTCATVFTPQVISGQTQNDILKKSFSRQCYFEKRPDLTSEQVAYFYYNHELSIGYNSSLKINEGEEADEIRDNLVDVIDLLFSESESVCDLLKDTLARGDIGFFKNSRLIKVDNRPIALSFVSYTVKIDDRKWGILYEEKTNTVISFTCEGVEMTFDNVKDINTCLLDTEQTMRNYYRKHVGTLIDNCYFYVDTSTVAEKSEKGCSAALHIHCGLMQYSDKGIMPEDLVFF